MRTLLSSACFLLGVISAFAKEQLPEDQVPEGEKINAAATKTQYVQDLTPETYFDAIQSNQAVLVSFYAPWCGKCKTVRKEFERAGKLVHDMGLPVKIARLDANRHAVFAKSKEVNNVPTYVLTRNNGTQVDTFPFLTTAEAIVAGLSKMLDLGLDITPAKVFDEGSLDIAEWLFWRGTDDGKLMTTLVLYMPEGAPGEDVAAQNKEAMSVFSAATKELLRFQNLRFAIVKDVEVLREFELPLDRPTLVLYKDHDEGRVVYSGPLESLALGQWVVRQDTPLVTDIWHKTLQSYRKRVQTLGLFFVSERQAEHPPTVGRLSASLLKVALELEARGYFRRGEFTIGIANGEKYASWANHFGLPRERFPSMGIENTTSHLDYRVPDFAVAGSRNVPTPVIDEDTGEPLVLYRPSPLVADEEPAVPRLTREANVDAATGESLEGEGKFSDKAVIWVDAPYDVLLQHFVDYFEGRLTPNAAQIGE